MGGNLSMYNLGSKGVNVDTNPIQLEDGELTSAQNTIDDPLGADGALSKRLGLVKFNGSAGAGSILGGIGVPLLKGTTFTLFDPRQASTRIVSSNYVSTDDGTTFGAGTNFFSIYGVRPQVGLYPFEEGGTERYLTGQIAAVLDNRVYSASAGNNYTSAAATIEPPSIYLFDGTTNREISRIPYNPDATAATAYSQGVTAMIAANGVIYLSTFDWTGSGDNWYSRVFELDPSNGQLTVIGSGTGSFTANYIVSSLAWYQGWLYAGIYTGTNTDAGYVYRFRPGVSSSWTLDHTTTAGIGGVVSLAVYNGNLYAGVIAKATSNGIVKQRTTLGAWSTSDTGSGTAAFNGYLALSVFGTNLYAAYYDSAGPTSLIRKYNGSSWSTVYTGAGGTAVPYSHFGQFHSYLFAAQTVAYSAPTAGKILRTSDGSSWTDISPTGSSTSAPGIVGIKS